jgi:hypothetical protein
MSNTLIFNWSDKSLSNCKIASSAPSNIVKPSDPQFVMPQEPLPANFSGSPFGTSY